MPIRELVGGSAAAVVAIGALFASIAPTQATMYRITQYSTPYIQHVDCAVSFHLRPAGDVRRGAADDPGPAVIERHDDNVGCESRVCHQAGCRGQ